jgi:hypothetical protein
MAARKSHPVSVQTAVTSVAHTSFGPLAEKSRASKFGAMGSSCFESVVVRNFFFRRATRPFSRMTCATFFSLTTSPRSRSSRHTRGLPYRPSCSANTARVFAARTASRRSRSVSGSSR